MGKLNTAAPDNNFPAGNQSFSNRFSLSAAASVQQFLYYRLDGSAPLPTRIHLADLTTLSDNQIDTPPDSWHPIGGNWWAYGGAPFVPFSYDLVGSRDYCLTYYFEYLTSRAPQTSMMPSPDSPATWGGSYTASGDVPDPPSLVSTDSAWSFDLVWDSYVPEVVIGGPTDPNGENHATQADLAAWLQSDNPSLRLDGLPKMAYDLLVLQAGAYGAASDKLDAISSALEAALGPSGDFLLGSLRLYLDGRKAEIDNILAVADGLLGARVDAIATDTAALVIAAAAGADVDRRNVIPVGDAGWEQVAYEAFEGTFVIDTAVDYVIVNMETWGSDRRINTFGGITFFETPWWWCPLRSGVVPGPYSTSMATNADLYEPGRRMGGVLVKLPPDFAGHYEAWLYTGM